MEIVDVEMNDIEFFRAGKDLFEHYVVVRELVDAVRVQAKRHRATGNEAGSSLGVAAGEQRDIVPHRD
jgi:hypothetical protein